MGLFDPPDYVKLWCPNMKRMWDYIVKPPQRPKCTCIPCQEMIPEKHFMSREQWDQMIKAHEETK
jgi:hypothetical protein